MFALIALGGNFPNGTLTPLQTQIAAIKDIKALGFTALKASRFFQSPAFPAGAGPDYVNSALCVARPDMGDAVALLQQLAKIEADHGRERHHRWGGRSLDLDLLAFGDRILPDTQSFRAWADLDISLAAQTAPDRLILPHPRLHERAFVLAPLMDISPDWRHPVFGKTVREMYAALPDESRSGVIALKA